VISIGTKLKIFDNCGAKLAKCLKIIKTGNKKTASAGNLVLVALSNFKSAKKVSKRIIYIGLIVGVNFWIARNEGTIIKFFSNNVLIFNKQYKFLGTRVYGIILKEAKKIALKSKKNRTYFKKIITYAALLI
jgi:large subunit ribosomal protein L14